MSEHIYLLGSEEVRGAGNAMRGAAEEMSRAAMNIQGALERHERFLDDWLLRLSDLVEAAKKGD